MQAGRAGRRREASQRCQPGKFRVSRLNVRSLLGQTSSSFSPGLARPRAPSLVLVLLLSPSEPLSGQVLGLGGAAYRLIHKINVGLEARPESLHEHGVARRGQEGLRQAQPGGEGVRGRPERPPPPLRGFRLLPPTACAPDQHRVDGGTWGGGGIPQPLKNPTPEERKRTSQPSENPCAF